MGLGFADLGSISFDSEFLISNLIEVTLERLAWCCRAMTCSPVIGRKVVDILQSFRL
jgi:hypothetical protein